jgi:hypothetical protein
MVDQTEEWVAIQLVVSTWLRKSGDDRSFKSHVVRKEVIVTLFLEKVVIMF